jgi:hypothetical protein
LQAPDLQSYPDLQSLLLLQAATQAPSLQDFPPQSLSDWQVGLGGVQARNPVDATKHHRKRLDNTTTEDDF